MVAWAIYWAAVVSRDTGGSPVMAAVAVACLSVVDSRVTEDNRVAWDNCSVVRAADSETF